MLSDLQRGHAAAAARPELDNVTTSDICDFSFCSHSWVRHQATLLICKGDTLPKFGLAWQEPRNKDMSIAGFEPVFGRRCPDVGPLNLRIVT